MGFVTFGECYKMVQDQWDDLNRLLNEVREKMYSRIDSEPISWQFDFAIASFRDKFNHLKLIHSRINEGIKNIKIEMNNSKRGDMFYGHSFDTLSLDIEDFFIHSRILMDRITNLVNFFLDIKDSGHDSFENHRKFFLKSENNPWQIDEEYAKYIREETSWFVDLRNARDDSIVHLHKKGKGKSLALIKGKIQCCITGYSSDKDRDKLKDLFEKNNMPVPDLRAMTPVDKALKILENNNRLEHKDNESKDNKRLSGIRQGIRGELPDIDLLLANILAFIEFFGVHFLQKLSQSDNTAEK